MNSITNIPTETNCRKKIYKIVWGDHCCSKCGSHHLKFRSKYEYCPDCKHKSSIKAETIFKNSKIKLRLIFALIYCWQNQLSIGETKRTTNLSYLTIRRYYKRFRTSLANDNKDIRQIVLNKQINSIREVSKQKKQLKDNKQQLEIELSLKLHKLVEIDESFFGKRRFGRQHCVIGAIERNTRKIKLELIDNRHKETIERFILNNVEQDSTVYTDSFHSYNDLNIIGYNHIDCNHSKGIFGPTNMIENLWSVIKRSLRNIHKTLSFNKEDLKYILIEWENRQNNPELFYNIDNYLKKCVCSV